MKLKVHELGDGDRTALLVHGIMASAGTWCRVAPLLAARGYRVLMPDLRGHGDSPHAPEYAPELFAGDLLESLPTGADVAIGHSLGALSLSLVAAELRPARAVYSDPAWKIRNAWDRDQLRAFAAATKRLTAEQVRRMAPKWADEDVAAELAGYARWDVRAADWLAEAADAVPDAPVVPSLVQAAGDPRLVPEALAADLRGKGFEVVRVPGTGHCVHRDDLDGFLRSLEGWI
ncbi:alpha/beta fold hydrolase [Actinomadura macrotermitis]|uniref:2-succinyl-6-hydroxy-2, 4-cyclohexadiene-1-carboxylate synthase n=1 Tax=Actinomadura macrotermitis TaxID=2585200 RepID=A0A7K0C6K8_9ACTN|nr:alpha/beta fold hydrolase [Actinomadura macrotermitis]MQY09101.1 2-succinyl-6-hydroxy-2,4-cyclohexadiene-1-carboxylate synthase [Actinomadura macrotermitis]